MRRSLVAAVLASLALAAQANDGVELSLRTRTLAAAAVMPAKQADAPFTAGRDPLPELMLREEQERRGPSGTACDVSTTALCYDLVDRRVNFRGARRYMPAIEGLKAESLSLRHDRLVFKYSFR